MHHTKIQQYTVWDFNALTALMELAHDKNFEWSGYARPVGEGFGFFCDTRIENDTYWGVLLDRSKVQKDE